MDKLKTLRFAWFPKWLRLDFLDRAKHAPDDARQLYWFNRALARLPETRGQGVRVTRPSGPNRHERRRKARLARRAA